MSRIWDAMMESERERARANAHGRGKKAATQSARSGQSSQTANSAQAGRPKNDGAERRKSKRWKQPVPVLVYGSDAEKQPFHEKTETIDINDDGCLLSIESGVAAGQHLFLTNLRNRAERECVVVHVGKRAQGKSQVGVNFLRPLRDSALPGPADFWAAV
ncbi:MAG TPA: PilZ domain-containing protein [Candidatus Acidoferrales bacterium]|nr:PilZ domain-containing protein [Candidatus Acidoferrales bacterium]